MEWGVYMTDLNKIIELIKMPMTSAIIPNVLNVSITF